LEHIGGSTTYTAPPLPKGEISSGLSNLLSNDVYRIRTTLYPPIPVPPSPATTSGSSSAGSAFFRTVRPGLRIPEVDTVALASANGSRMTQMLIEAIFNPVPARGKAAREGGGLGSPFVYYEDEEGEDGMAAGETVRGGVSRGYGANGHGDNAKADLDLDLDEDRHAAREDFESVYSLSSMSEESFASAQSFRSLCSTSPSAPPPQPVSRSASVRSGKSRISSRSAHGGQNGNLHMDRDRDGRDGDGEKRKWSWWSKMSSVGFGLGRGTTTSV
jgi:hypothetical protein